MHPSDTAPAPVALQASVVIAGPNGRRTVAVENLHVPPSEDYTRETVIEPDEIITEIVFTAARSGAAKLLPQGAGAPGLGLRPGRNSSGHLVQRGSGG